MRCLVGCRADIPQEVGGYSISRFVLPLDAHFDFNNWVLDYYGNYIPSTLFRTSWLVVDTSAVWAGYSHVTVVVESTYSSPGNSLADTRARYFRTSSIGDVYEWGFISHLLAERDTVVVSSMWDKIFSPATTAGVTWLVESNDSASVGNVYASIQPSQELVSTVVNGVSIGIPAFRVDLTGTNLDLRLWFSTSPSALLRSIDNSYVDGVRILQELRSLNTSG